MTEAIKGVKNMKKITTKMFISLLENKEERFAVIINHWFYYIEKGRVYRFQQHSNTKMLTIVGSFYEDEIDSETMVVELKKVLSIKFNMTGLRMSGWKRLLNVLVVLRMIWKFSFFRNLKIVIQTLLYVVSVLGCFSSFRIKDTRKAVVIFVFFC